MIYQGSGLFTSDGVGGDLIELIHASAFIFILLLESSVDIQFLTTVSDRLPNATNPDAPVPPEVST